MGLINFGDEPGLKSKISACGPSVHIRQTGAFLGIARGLHAAQGKPSETRISPWPPRFSGPIDVSPGHVRRWLRFGTFLAGYLRLQLTD